VILLEVAFAIPLLIAILYYLHDIPKYKRIQAKMDFCIHCAVNLIQNISQNRSNKKIILKDFAYILGTVLIPHFGGGTDQYQIGEGHVYKRGYLIAWSIAYLKGVGNGQVKILWEMYNDWMSAPFDMKIVPGIRFFPAPGQTVNVNQIMDGLSLKNGEYKMVLGFCPLSGSTLFLLNGENALTTTWREKFGFLFWKPSFWVSLSVSSYYSPSLTKVAFTPNPGLFDENLPGQ
jgi:hypothetical protein